MKGWTDNHEWTGPTWDMWLPATGDPDVGRAAESARCFFWCCMESLDVCDQCLALEAASRNALAVDEAGDSDPTLPLWAATVGVRLRLRLRRDGWARPLLHSLADA